MSRAVKTDPEFLPEVFASVEEATQSAAEFNSNAEGATGNRIPRHSVVQDWRSQNGWGVILAKTRLDAFSHEQMVEEIDSLRRAGCVQIAIDMRPNRFLSLQTIRYLVTLGEELHAEQGRVSLVAPVEKIKRHFEIYGSLTTISIVKFVEELTRSRQLPSRALDRAL